jgi:hypothetical protein
MRCSSFHPFSIPVAADSRVQAAQDDYSRLQVDYEAAQTVARQQMEALATLRAELAAAVAPATAASTSTSASTSSLPPAVDAAAAPVASSTLTGLRAYALSLSSRTATSDALRARLARDVGKLEEDVAALHSTGEAARAAATEAEARLHSLQKAVDVLLAKSRAKDAAAATAHEELVQAREALATATARAASMEEGLQATTNMGECEQTNERTNGVRKHGPLVQLFFPCLLTPLPFSVFLPSPPPIWCSLHPHVISSQ